MDNVASEQTAPLFEDEYRDHIATVDGEGKRIWIYPKKPSGRFYNARIWVSIAFLVVFLTLPWVKFNGEPLFLFNLLQRKFILFGILFTPQDFHLFVLVMLTFFVFIILFTVVFGRLFCGWVCPQTVFMEMVFRKIEYWIEGNANEQRKLDKAPWDRVKIRKKLLKHAIFFVIAVVVSNYFLAYIIGMDQVVHIMRAPVSQHTGGFATMLLFSGIFYGVYARLREQVCTTICPYGRLQGVLLVDDSIVIAYDNVRGEPRGKLKKQKVEVPPVVEAAPCKCTDCDGDGKCGANKALRDLASIGPKPAIGGQAKALADNPVFTVNQPAAPAQIKSDPVAIQGDCIDCSLCIAVCPTGIDIRNGTQLECVNCTACIDACDQVMDKIGKPRGLIRYDSMTGIRSGKRKIFTPRVYGYSAVLLALMLLDMALLFNRGKLETIIFRSPGQLYQQPDSTHITNLYTLQLISKTTETIPVELRPAPGIPAIIRFIGAKPDSLRKGARIQGVFFLEIPSNQIQRRKTPITLEVWSNGEKIDYVKTNFLGPG